MARKTTLARGDQSPWGIIDRATELHPGLFSVSTPGHGGYWVSDERRAEMPAQLRELQSKYTPLGWYEEDCDWALVPIALPHCFSDEQCWEAVETALALGRQYEFLRQVSDYLQGPGGALARQKAQNYVRSLNAQRA